MSDEMAARVATQVQARVDQEAVLKAAIDSLQLRQWCVEQSLRVCGDKFGIVWVTNDGKPPVMQHAVVAIAEDIFSFVAGGEKT